VAVIRCCTLGAPVKMSATPPNGGRPASHLDSHTRAVLIENGYDDATIAAIVRSGDRHGIYTALPTD
jgi:crotonobetainyl-CoA:carnitine CoA-transferase CaiB-like acyl-CoA transferase